MKYTINLNKEDVTEILAREFKTDVTEITVNNLNNDIEISFEKPIKQNKPERIIGFR